MSNDRSEDDEQERKLFVGGLEKQNTDEGELKNYFEQFGTIIDCTIMRDQERLSRGFGFVLFEDKSSVDKVMSEKKDGFEFSLNDHHIEIKRALPKVPGGNAGTSRTRGLSRKIFVGGLPSTMTEEDLKDYFEKYGRVNEIELLRDRETSRLRGFAFVTFDDEDNADKCVQRRSHEICKKTCEVKRAQAREQHHEQYRRPGVYDNRDSRRNNESFGGGAPAAAPGSMSMTEVNQLIQQAFVMGQQNVQAPTAATLMNSGNAQPSSNMLLQALMNRQPVAAPPAMPAPVAPTPSNTAALQQLAQLLQGSGVDANALGALLKNGQSAGAAPADKAATTYSTAYPSVPSYDYKSSSNYGQNKDDGKRYQPY